MRKFKISAVIFVAVGLLGCSNARSDMDFYEFKIHRSALKVEIVENLKTKNEKVEEIEVVEEVGEQKIDWQTFEVSFYCSCALCCGSETGVTASGVGVQEGRTIAAPSSIPFGTEVYIEGLGSYVVEDRGGYIKNTYDENGNLIIRVDVYVDSHQKALENGRYNAKGYFKLNK